MLIYKVSRPEFPYVLGVHRQAISREKSWDTFAHSWLRLPKANVKTPISIAALRTLKVSFRGYLLVLQSHRTFRGRATAERIALLAKNACSVAYADGRL